MDKLKAFIEKKKKTNNSITPKYGTRKLTVGMVSCILGYLILVSPTIVKADSLIMDKSEIAEPKVEATNYIETDKDQDANKSEEDKEIIKVRSEEVENVDEHLASTLSEDSSNYSEETEQTNFKLTDEQKEKLVKSGFTDKEISKIEKEINEKLNIDSKFDVDKYVTDKIKEKEDNKLELSDEKVDSAVNNSEMKTGTRSIKNEVHYEALGETDKGVLVYAGANYRGEEADGIHIRVSKWADHSTSWGRTDVDPYRGRFILSFFDDEFYKNIYSVKVLTGLNNRKSIEFEKEADGALWKVPINIDTFASGAIAVVTNHEVVITLKDGKTLADLGLADRKIDFQTVWVRGVDGLIDANGTTNGFILKNSKIPAHPENPKEGNEYFLGRGVNGATTDGTKSRDGNFISGEPTKKVIYDSKEKKIKSVVSFKPDQNFMQANSGWVIYLNEIIPSVLQKYIDQDNVYIAGSDFNGNFKRDPVKLNFVVDENGHLSTKDTDVISIVGGDWKKTADVRAMIDNRIFWGALGQKRSYTIQYGLKEGISNEEFVEALNAYIKEHGQLDFESWMEADFVDETPLNRAVRKPDGGKANKRLQNSYSTAFLEVLDTDRDGIFDFIEDELGLNKYVVDTDGDGVPDNEEYKNNQIDGKDSKSYLVNAPTTESKFIIGSKDQTIIGVVPRDLYDNPNGDINEDGTPKKLLPTNEEAGGVIIRAYKYVEGDDNYSDNAVLAETTIPFDRLVNGTFELNIPANTFADGDKIVLLAFSPDGKSYAQAQTFINVESNMK